MLGWQGAGKILADNLGACLQHSRGPAQPRTPSRSAVPIYFPDVFHLRCVEIRHFYSREEEEILFIFWKGLKSIKQSRCTFES